MNHNMTIGLEPVVPQHSNATGINPFVDIGASLLKSGDCFFWDNTCQKNATLDAQARLEEAKAANTMATNQSENSKNMLIMAGAGVLVVLMLMAMMMKRGGSVNIAPTVV